MFIHTFGCYFGLTASRILQRDAGSEKVLRSASYTSDLLSMIGTLFLWVYWPSFNAATAGPNEFRATVNTILSLCGAVVTTFAFSSWLGRGELKMLHIQNSTLAGGVAAGTIADMSVSPGGACLVGSVAGIISVLGYEYLTPWMEKKLHLTDTCGIHNLHGMPGLLGGLAGIIASAVATEGKYHHPISEVFAHGRDQPKFQVAAWFITPGIAILSSVLCTYLVKAITHPMPQEKDQYNDEESWEVPKETVAKPPEPSNSETAV